MTTNPTNAICVPGTDIPNAFNTYIKSCRSNEDSARASNFFSESISTIQDQFHLLRAQFDDLIKTGDAVDTMANLTGNSSGGVSSRIENLQQKHKTLQDSIEEKRRIANSADRSFLEDIMHKQPHRELAPSIQDGALLIFWFGWLVMVLTLVAIRWFSPGGTWQAGMITLLLLTLLTVCVYGLLIRIA